ncbi:hypothetical protein CSX04_01019 [Burkholderia cepacia]|nr:hypothetical protein CSX04_01019 [Burkholderia cepacia]
MLIHHYSPSTGEYLTSSQPDADPRNDGRWLIPSSATLDAPPPRTPTTWPFYRDGAWFLLPDYRGRVCYRTDTGEPVEIAIAGKTPDDLELTTEPRPSPRHAWIDDAWTVPPELIAREKRDAAMAEFERLMEIARRANAGKADAYAAACSTTKAPTTSKPGPRTRWRSSPRSTPTRFRMPWRGPRRPRHTWRRPSRSNRKSRPPSHRPDNGLSRFLSPVHL